MTRTLTALCAAFVLLGGCSTYLAEKADLEGGGAAGSQRVLAAQQRLQAAQDKQAGLKEDELSAQEEREAAESELATVNRNLATQNAKLAKAEAAGKITKAQEQQRRRELEDLTASFQTASLKLQTKQNAGDAAGVSQQQQELARLKAEIDATNQEIGILAK